MGRKVRLTEGQLRQIIRETQKQNIVEGGWGDIPRHIWRHGVGQVDGAKKIKSVVWDLWWGDASYPGSNEFKNKAEQLIGMLKSFGVDWARPEAGGLNIFDHIKLQKVIDDYEKDPRDDSPAAKKFDSTMRELYNVLDAFIKGEKV